MQMHPAFFENLPFFDLYQGDKKTLGASWLRTVRI